MASEDNPHSAYTPSKPAAIACAIVFLALTLLQTWKIIRSRKWFGLAIVIGGLFEVLGLAARAYNVDHPTAKTPLIMQTLLILLAPILFAASIYMFLGRLIRASGHPQLSPIRITWLTKIFVAGDVLCFLIQAAGAAKLVNAQTNTDANSDPKESADAQKTGQNIILAGLGLQVAVFVIFALCAVIFHMRVSSARFRGHVDPALRLGFMLGTLYATSLLITVRNAFRFVEYVEGQDGYLLSHEWPMYALDIVLMAVIMAITLVWYGVDMAGAGKAEAAAYPLVYQEVGGPVVR
ncbi:RTA1 like protein-domain-containing protein [Aspergillus carlsbadensis]|nr:RTA1 like protein-domain-containing protein [Aspergillus carlsbadensis]